MKNRVKPLMLVLAVLMAISLLAACAGGNAPEETSSETLTETQDGYPSETSAPAPSAAETAAETHEVSTEASSREPLEPSVERVPDDRHLTAAEYSVLNITGTDDFGRVISPVDGKVNTDRYVGMFYFLTLGQHANHTGIYDINLITYESTYHEAFTNYDTFITPVGSAHFWGEPVWGYYHSEDV